MSISPKPRTLSLLRHLVLAAVLAGLFAPAALASTTQESLIEDNGALLSNLPGSLQTFRALGVTRLKVTVDWNQLAPDPGSHRAPAHFNATNPASYAAGYLDTVIREATADGLQIGVTVTGPAPLWATGRGAPRGTSYANVWRPSPKLFGELVYALGRRYDGHYRPPGSATPLPRVSWWSIWNEPNYGPDLGPQATAGNTVYTGAELYRGLLAAAWRSLRASGHSTPRDTILIGETAPRGVVARGFPGNFSGTVPITFIQALYCVTPSGREMTGGTARTNGCPGSAARFRAQNPALFDASGFAAHPYAQGTPPNVPTYQCGINHFCFNTRTKRSSPGYADLAVLPRLERLLRRLTHHQVPIWNTEYGYWTNPPDHAHGAISESLASYYMNWAEYLSYRYSWVRSYDQYLLRDESDGKFASGLELPNGAHKATFSAFQMPLYMPTTRASHAGNLLVWGAARPAAYALTLGALHPRVQVQFQPRGRGAFRTIATVVVRNPRGYFEARVPFTENGNVRIVYRPLGGGPLVSRTQAISVR